MAIDVFLSVGRTSSDEQEAFVQAVERLLRARGLNPRTVGRSDFTSRAPLLRIRDVLDECHGTVVLALERSSASNYVDRPGSAEETTRPLVRMPTVWNQIEAAMSYTRGLPLLVIVERGLRSEGLLETGYDWYVQWVDIDDSALRTDEFLGVLDDWVKEVGVREKGGPPAGDGERSVAQYTLKELVGGLTVPQAWALIGAIVSVLVVVATAAYKVGAA